MRAKTLMFSNLGKCVAVSLIASAIGILGGLLSSGFVPAVEEMVHTDGTIDIALYTSTMTKTLLIGIIVSIISCPLTFGMYEFFMNLTRNRAVAVVDVFNWFGEGKRFMKALGASLWYSLISIGWALLFEAVPIVLLVILLVFIDVLSIPVMMFMYVVSVVLVMVASVLAMIQTQRYIVAMYMIAGDPERKVRETFRLCKEMTKGKKWEIFVLSLSFIGWQLLAAFTCGMSVLFVTPYMNLTFAVYSEHILTVNGYGSQPMQEEPPMDDENNNEINH